MDHNPPGSSVRGILQASILEWLPFPSPGHIPSPGIEPASPAMAGGLFTTDLAGKPSFWPWAYVKVLEHPRSYLNMLVNFPDVQSSNWYGKILSVGGDRWSANRGRVLVHLCLAMSGLEFIELGRLVMPQVPDLLRGWDQCFTCSGN